MVPGCSKPVRVCQVDVVVCQVDVVVCQVDVVVWQIGFVVCQIGSGRRGAYDWAPRGLDGGPGCECLGSELNGEEPTQWT
jgi:hypothetical protein